MVILTPSQLHFLNAFFDNPLNHDFFLSGGTALAEFYLKHRLSQDLDLFTVNQEIKFDAVNAEMLKTIEREKYKIEDRVTSNTFLRYILIAEDNLLKIDLVKDVPIHFGEIKKFGKIRVDSLENIAVGKLLALFGRADPKDFVDLYFLLENDKLIKFEEILTLAKQKDLGLQEIYLAEMIFMVEKLNLFPGTIKEYQKDDLVKFFINLGEKLLKQIKPAE